MWRRCDRPAVMRPLRAGCGGRHAREQVKAEAHYVTPHKGGEGAGRDAIEFILKARGCWRLHRGFDDADNRCRLPSTLARAGLEVSVRSYPTLAEKKNAARWGTRFHTLRVEHQK